MAFVRPQTRMANSRLRPVARTSKRLSTLAQAMRKNEADGAEGDEKGATSAGDDGVAAGQADQEPNSAGHRQPTR
jgi:hypothetical protein